MARVLIGNVKGSKGDQGDPGEDYVLTDADKSEIANTVASEINLDGKLDKSGGAMTGTLTASYSADGGQVRNVYIVTAEPDASVGQDGDIAFVIGG